MSISLQASSWTCEYVHKQQFDRLNKAIAQKGPALTKMTGNMFP